MEAMLRQMNTSTTSKILRSQKQQNSFKTIKAILLITPSKNAGILRNMGLRGLTVKIERICNTRPNLQNGLGEKFIGTIYRQVCMFCYTEYKNYD